MLHSEGKQLVKAVKGTCDGLQDQPSEAARRAAQQLVLGECALMWRSGIGRVAHVFHAALVLQLRAVLHYRMVCFADTRPCISQHL